MDLVDEGIPWQPADDLERLYQPTDAAWPLYGITVRRETTGLTIYLSYKAALDEWWVTVDHHRPLPYDLVPVLIDMISHSFPLTEAAT